MKYLQRNTHRLQYYGYLAGLIGCSYILAGCSQASDATLAPSEQPAVTTPAHSAESVSPLIARDWMLVKFANYTRSDLINNKAQLHFVADGQFYADMGCNKMGGRFVDNSDGSVTFSSLFSTKMACMDLSGKLEQDFMTQLDKITHYHVEGHQLSLLNGDDVAMVFVAADWD